MADEAGLKIEALLGALRGQFELVVEAAEGLGGRLEALRQEMVSQFAEVGRQVRFLCDQIGDNRNRLSALRSDFAAEMVRLNEVLGATRVELQSDFSGLNEIKQALSALAQGVGGPDGEVAAGRLDQLQKRLSTELERQVAKLRRDLSAQLAELGKQARSAPGPERKGGAAEVISEISAETHLTNKTLANLIRKLDRFDDRISVQIKDQDQRLRKLERHLARG